MAKRNAICMISGGVDSVTTAYYVRKVVKPPKQLLIFCNYRQRTYEYEEFCIKKIAKMLEVRLKLIDLGWLGKISTSILTKKIPIPETKVEELWDPEKARERILRWWDPCRNSILLLVGLAHAESFYISKGERYDVYIGIRRESPVMMKDNTPEFLEQMNRVAEHATHHGGYKILAPLLKHDKGGVVKLGEKLGVPWEYTYSCYAGVGFTRGKKFPVHCGRCSNCRRRYLAFRDAGVRDPTIYAEPPAEA